MILSSGIYSIANTSNNKIYFGSATNLPKRWVKHQQDLENNKHPNKHPNKHLQYAYNKKINLEYKVLFYCTTANLLFYEQRVLDIYWDNGIKCYNICKTAGSMLGFKHSKETKNKMSESRLGKPGKPHTEKTKAILASYRIGMEASLETKHKMSNSRGTRPIYSKLTSVEVNEIRDLTKSSLFTYTKIAKFYGISRTHVSRIYRNLCWVK